MPTDAYGGQAAVVDGKIYVIGGFYSANNFYDPSQIIGLHDPLYLTGSPSMERLPIRAKFIVSAQK